MKKTRMLSLAMAAVMAAALTACGGTQQVAETKAESKAESQPEEQAETQTEAETEAEAESFAHESYAGQEELVVTVGDFLAEAFLYPVKIANEKGFFEEEFAEDNIRIDVQYIGSGAVMVEALTANQLSMSFLGGQPCFSGISNDAGFKVVSMATYSATDPVLLVAEDSDITEVAQLKGRTMAVNIGTDNHYQMLEMMALGDVTEDDIELYNLKGQEAYAALISGQVDCMQSVSPNTYKFLNNGDVRILTDMSQTGSRNNQVLVASDQFIEEHPEIISRFLKVLQRALDYYEENREECYDLLAVYTEADRDLMDSYMDNYDCSLHLDQHDMDTMASEYEFLYQHDMLSKEIDLNTIYDTRFLIDAFGTAEER